MDKTKKILSEIVGLDGLEVLEKAVFKRGTQAIIDPLEFYFPLIVAPRSILSWLVQNIKPLKVGEHKELPFPGKEEIKIYVEKQDIDQYRAEFRQGSKIIHSFEKQSLPAASAHLMTVGEMYESFTDNKPELIQEPKQDIKEEEPSEKGDSKDIVRSIIEMNEVKPQTEDPEHLKWVVSHANVKELTGVIGKLVDALVAKKVSKENLDKMSVKEHEGDEHVLSESISPKEKDQKDRKQAGKPSNVLEDYKEETKVHRELLEDTLRDKDTFKAPKIQEVKSGEEAAEAKIKKEELLSKPYTSEAQRRYFHAAAARGEIPKKTVEHWDKESKGKKLPEKVSQKQEMGFAGSPGPGSPNALVSPKTEMSPKGPSGSSVLRKLLKPSTVKSEDKIEKGSEAPAGAGIPKQPKPPLAPKAPIPPSNRPAQSAAKQAEASGKGKTVMPKTPGAPKLKNGTSDLKPPSPGAAVLKLKSMATKQTKMPLAMSEKAYILTESQVYNPCTDCGRPEFIKGEDGNPKFNPCACFSVMRNDESGRPFKFVSVLKKHDNSFELNFSPKADHDSIKAFLLTLKASLLVKRKFNKNM